MIAALGIPTSLCVAVMGVFVASFAGTTLDTATRIQRSGQRESIDSRLPTEPCVRVRTRLLMLLLSIDQD